MADQLDTVFAALVDPTRRAVVTRPGEGEAAITELAAPHDMALSSFLKHIDKLERAGLVRSRKAGRLRICTLHPEALAIAVTWLGRQRADRDARLDRLDAFLRTEPL